MVLALCVCVCVCVCVRACVCVCVGDVCLYKALGLALSAAATHAVISDFLQEYLYVFFYGSLFDQMVSKDIETPT